MDKNKSGFSLIELSISLIIISLLFAAITSGNSIFQTSKLTTAVAQFNHYRSAYLLFNTKFQKLPGDYDKAMGAFTAHGNNDKKVQFFNNQDSGSVNESAVAWQNLKLGRFMDDKISYVSLTDFVLATNANMKSKMPKSRINGAYWIFDYNFFGISDGVTSPKLSNMILLSAIPSDFSAQAGTWDGGDGTKVGYTYSASTSTALSMKDASFIDRKIDDGIANKGLVRGQGSNCIANDNISYNPAGSCNLQFYNGMN